MDRYDKIIIGAGLYGLYSALYCGKKNKECLFWSAIRHRSGEPRISIRREFTRGTIIPDPYRRQ